MECFIFQERYKTASEAVKTTERNKNNIAKVKING